MHQMTRALVLADHGALARHRVLICDRDAKWSRVVRDQLTNAGLRVVQTPYRAPNANAHAERFERSIKEECLHRIVPLGERHFRHTVSEFVTHYQRERPHKRCGNRLLEPRQSRQPRGRITRRPRLGGLLNFSRASGLMRAKSLGRIVRHYELGTWLVIALHCQLPGSGLL